MNNTLHLSPANEARRARAARRNVAAARRILDARGNALPQKLALIGRLRVEHPDASLAELGQMVDPPLSKDTVASRLRRFIALDVR